MVHPVTAQPLAEPWCWSSARITHWGGWGLASPLGRTLGGSTCWDNPHVPAQGILSGLRGHSSWAPIRGTRLSPQAQAPLSSRASLSLCVEITGQSHNAPCWLKGTHLTVSHSSESPAGFLSSPGLCLFTHQWSESWIMWSHSTSMVTAVIFTLRMSPSNVRCKHLPQLSGKLLASGRKCYRHHTTVLVYNLEYACLVNVLQFLCIISMNSDYCPINWVLF